MPRRVLFTLTLLLAALPLMSACGDDPSLDEARRRADAAGRAEAGVGDPADAQQVAPTRRATAVGRRLDALAAAFAPVTARINFLVAAETLRQDAIESGASEQVELEHTGAVRVELRRLRAVLQETRPKVGAVAADGDVPGRVQALLTEAIDARQRALVRLESVLDGIARDVGESVVDERLQLYRAAWDESVRATREATTLVQEERARLGLQPAPEEAMR